MTHNKTVSIHILFLFITLFLGNLVSFLLFNNLTTFYHDNLDGIVVENKILGEFYSGNESSIEIFLNGELKIFYHRHFLKPFILIYSILDVEFAYFFTEFLVKLIAYFSFFIFAKKFAKNLIIISIFSALYASSLPFKTLGFGLAVLPYIIYLVLFKEKLKTKHFFFIFFFGINTDFVADFFFIPILISIIFLINKKLLLTKTRKIFLISTIFFFFAALTSSNLIYIKLFDPTTHRIEFYSEPLSFFESIKSEIFTFFQIPNSLNWTTIKNLPYQIIIYQSIIFLFLIKNNLSKKIFILIIFLHILSIIFNLTSNTVFGFKLSWIDVYKPSLFIFLLFFLSIKKTNKIKKTLTYLSIFPLILFQISSSAVPFIKKNIFKIQDYRNVYTFKDYYMIDDYQEIKKIVQENRVATIGYDPLIAAFNGIPVIDGYHALYPLDYKKKFYKLIKKELDKNALLNSYYQNWGSRVYLFVDNENNIEIDFLEAKKIGAKYIISKLELSSSSLDRIKGDFKEKIYLYKIK